MTLVNPCRSIASSEHHDRPPRFHHHYPSSSSIACIGSNNSSNSILFIRSHQKTPIMTKGVLEGQTLGFYGGGVMAEALLRGILDKEVISASQIWVCEIVEARRDMLAKLGVSVTADGKELLHHSDIIILAIKPDVIPIVLRTVTQFEKGNHLKHILFISICAGVRIKALKVGNAKRICIRVLPNQPCMVGEAASAFTLSEGCADEHRQIVKHLMGACGLITELPEKYIDAVTGVSGSGPAYVYMMIEAMSDAGVREGLPRAVARQLAAQTVLGAAKMALESPDVHLGELRNRVESPGGTTIAATASLEENGFRSAVIEAVSEATQRSKELGGDSDEDED